MIVPKPTFKIDNLYMTAILVTLLPDAAKE